MQFVLSVVTTQNRAVLSEIIFKKCIEHKDLPCVKVGKIDEKSSLKPKLFLEFPVDSNGKSLDVDDSDGKVIPVGDS